MGESQRLETALRAAMMMSSELDQNRDSILQTPQAGHSIASEGTEASSVPATPIRHSKFLDPPSRSSSPSVSTSSISLSLSTPASPVSLSSVPESMALSMDLDSSATWSLSADSRSGSPAAARDRRRDAAPPSDTREELRSSRASEGTSMVPPSRPQHPYAISRRNTATIPQILRTATANNDPGQGDLNANAAHLGSFRSDVTTTDIHSRSHWAVQESIERQRYQGDLFELVLPVLEIPAASVTTATSASKDTVEKERPQAASSSTTKPADDHSDASVINIVLCGTNRTTNIFLRELMQDPRFEIYKLPNASPAGSDISRSQVRHGSGKTAIKEAYYTVGVYALGVAMMSDVSADTDKGRRLVAKMTVFGRGQQGNLEKVRSPAIRDKIIVADPRYYLLLPVSPGFGAHQANLPPARLASSSAARRGAR